MKCIFYAALQLLFLFGFVLNTHAQADVTLTTSTTPASSINQGTTGNILYVAKMAVATQPVVVSSVDVPISGTVDANDISAMYVYFNATAPTISGATLLNGIVPSIAAPHTYNIAFTQSMAIGSSGYFIVTANLSVTATDGNTIVINGATNPLVFSFTAAANVTNNQSNVAGTTTIQAANITVATNATASATIAQSSVSNILYVAKMDVATQPVVVSSVDVPINGTMDANDISAMYVYFNATAPTVTGATLLNGIVPSIAAPHTYNISFTQAMAIGSSGYFIVTANTSATATDGNTIVINGATNPLVFGFTTGPNITNNQSNIAGTNTIQAANVTVATNATAAAFITQGSVTNILYVAKMDVATQPVVVSSVDVPINGTVDANDLSAMYVYFNATAPTISGASLLNGIVSSSAAPHTYNISFTQSMAIGSSGYFIVTANTSATATDGNTIVINGATNPLVFGFTTGPNITNNQSNIAGTNTIQAANVTVATNATAAAFISQGSVTNILYVAKMDVATQAVVVSSIDVPINGTVDANDLSAMYVYFNATAPTISGATLLNGIFSSSAAPHTYNISFSQPMAIGSSGYFILTANASATATDGNTIIMNGATNPLVFNFTTGPNITNNQSNIAGTHTIQAANVIVTTDPVAASIIKVNSAGNVVYTAKLDATTQAVVVSSADVPLTGTVNATDISALYVYFNAAAPTISGATLLNGVFAGFAAPHTYSISFSQAMAPGTSGYFIFTLTTSSTAIIGHTVKVDGAASPVVFGFTTNPNVTNNQTDLGGIQTLPVNLLSLAAKAIQDAVEVKWTTSDEINNAYFDIERSADGVHFVNVGSVPAGGAGSLIHTYSFIDREPETGVNYYRLKQVDLNSHFQYSKVVETNLQTGAFRMSSVYPNPVKNMLSWSVYTPNSKQVLVQLSAISGNILSSQHINLVKGKNPQLMNVARFPAGQYLLSVTDAEKNTRLQQKIVIVQ